MQPFRQFALALALSAAPLTALAKSHCPTAEDLKDGIIYIDPASKGQFDKMWRHLDGPYYGTAFINNIFKNRQTVSYSGLFTYKHFANGELVQLEEPQGDVAALLEFEIATKHTVKTLRQNPQKPERRWIDDITYRITAHPPVTLEDCTYDAVKIYQTGEMTMPDDSTKPIRKWFVYLPELKLRVQGAGLRYGPVMSVRKRSSSDPEVWPFTDIPASVLVE